MKAPILSSAATASGSMSPLAAGAGACPEAAPPTTVARIAAANPSRNDLGSIRPPSCFRSAALRPLGQRAGLKRRIAERFRPDISRDPGTFRDRRRPRTIRSIASPKKEKLRNES